MTHLPSFVDCTGLNIIAVVLEPFNSLSALMVKKIIIQAAFMENQDLLRDTGSGWLL